MSDSKNTKVQVERLAVDALAALSGAGIATPEKGYVEEPWALAGDIARLAKERDEARAALATAHRRAATFEDEVLRLRAELADARAVQACTEAWLDSALDEHARLRVRLAQEASR